MRSRPKDPSGSKAGSLRGTRRRSFLGGVQRPPGHELRLLFAISGAYRPACRGPGRPGRSRHHGPHPLYRLSGAMTQPVVGIVMGSDSDWDVMQHAARRLNDFGVEYEARVVSAHRTPDLLYRYAEEADGRGLRCIIAGAGGAAHLPGMLAAKTTIPVLGVPVPSKYLHGQDSLLSIVQMPRGIPVATFAIGEAGAANAALFAAAILALTDTALAERLVELRAAQTGKARAMRVPPAAS